MQITDADIGFANVFAIQLEHDMNHAVHRRMRWPHVHQKTVFRMAILLRATRFHELAQSFLAVLAQLILANPIPECIDFCIHIRFGIFNQWLPFIERIVLAQRMAFEFIIHQNPPQIRVAFKFDAEHIPNLALEPIGNGPNRRHRRHDGICFRHINLQPQALVSRHRQQMINHDETRFFTQIEPVNRGQIHQKIELRLEVIFEKATHVDDSMPGHGDHVIADAGWLRLHLVAKASADLFLHCHGLNIPASDFRFSLAIS